MLATIHYKKVVTNKTKIERKIVYLHHSQVWKLLQLGRYEISRTFIKGKVNTFFVVRLQFLAVATPGSLEDRLSNKNIKRLDWLTVNATRTFLEES
jgi:hypothetical protein